MKPLHQFLLHAGFEHAAVSPEQMASYLEEAAFKRMTGVEKLNLTQDLEGGYYSRVHIYRLKEWSEDVIRETHGNPEQRLHDALKQFEDRNPKGPKMKYMQEDNPQSRQAKSTEFKRQVLVLESKRGLFATIFAPLGF